MATKIPPRQKGLLTVDEAAHYLSVTSDWLRVHERKGDIQAVRLGVSVRFRVEDLDKFVDDRIVEA